jgi:hypothetical protein
MRRLITLAVLVTLVVGMAAPAAQAGNAATNAALGLASFALFNQIVAPFLFPRPPYAYPAYAPYPRPVVVAPPPVYPPPAPAVVAAPPVVVAGAPAFAYRRVIHYRHGRYVLMGGGLYTPYRWVWIPAAPHRWAPMPPPPPAP